MEKRKNELLFTQKLKLVLTRNISRVIENKKQYSDIEYHPHALSGLVSTLTRIIHYSSLNKRYNSVGNLDGYHIFSSDLTILKKNKLNQHFIFFERHQDSTYHRNNSHQSESNGYSHWYIYSDLIQDSWNLANYLTYRSIKHSNKYGHLDELYKSKVKDSLHHKIDENNLDLYIKMDNRIFLKSYKLFNEGAFDGFLNILYKIKGSDYGNVYIDNSVTSESLDGYGRAHTTLGSIPKSVRYILLDGYTEVDINSAIQSILINLYYLNTLIKNKKNDLKLLKNDFPSHYFLHTNKNRFRDKYSSTFKCDEALAKKIITSISYSPKSRIIYKYMKKRKYLFQGSNFSRMYEFSRKQMLAGNELIQPHITETIKLRDAVLEKFYYQEGDSNEYFKFGNLFVKYFKKLIDEDIRKNNKKQKGNGRGKSLSDRRIYRIYELVEHQIREEMISYIKSKGGENIYQLHDCVIFKGEIDPSELKCHIFQKLNILVSFSKEKYRQDSGNAKIAA